MPTSINSSRSRATYRKSITAVRTASDRVRKNSVVIPGRPLRVEPGTQEHRPSPCFLEPVFMGSGFLAALRPRNDDNPGPSQQPALMFAFKGSDAIIRFRSGGRGRLGGAHSRRQDPKTPVEQALMRGLVTA